MVKYEFEMRKRKKGLKLFFYALLPALIFLVFLASGKDGKVFTTNTGHRYHRETCSHLRSSKIGITLEEAVRGGLTPCEICNPPRHPTKTGMETGAVNVPVPRSVKSSETDFSREASYGDIYRVNQHLIKTSDAANISQMVRAKVISHVDGDTVRVQITNPPAILNERETIRMLGVDTPETRHPSRPVEYFGKEASDFTRSALLGRQVYLAFDWDLRDQYGRLLSYIYTASGQCFNARLIREGYAHAYTRFPFQFMDEFRRLEQEARRAKRGLWGG